MYNISKRHPCFVECYIILKLCPTRFISTLTFFTQANFKLILDALSH